MDHIESQDTLDHLSSNINLSRQKSDLALQASNEHGLNFSNISKEKSEFNDNHEEILSKDTEDNDDMTRLEERESPSPSHQSKKGKKNFKASQSIEYPKDEEMGASFMQTRNKRITKKPTDMYAEKTREEEEKLQARKKAKPAPKKTKTLTNKESLSEDTQMELETPADKPRHEIGYEWKDRQLQFQEGLSSLTSQEFIDFIKLLMVDKPECVSFEKGYLELKITPSKAIPAISKDEYALTNQMMVQNRTFVELMDYIAKIKGNSSNKGKAKKGAKSSK